MIRISAEKTLSGIVSASARQQLQLHHAKGVYIARKSHTTGLCILRIDVTLYI
jgi:hypothetical protein